MDGGADIGTVIDISTNWRKARLDPADYAMLEFTEKLTLLPSAMVPEDVAALRRCNFGDTEILSIVLAAAYRNFIIRVADSLGAELDPAHSFPTEILGAFGVSEDEARTTLYRDRQVDTEELSSSPLSQPIATGKRSSSEAVCWIDISSTDPELAASVTRELETASMPYPVTNLATALSGRPTAMQAVVGLAKLVGMNGSGLGTQAEAIIGIVVAHHLGVPYMGVHHAQAFLDAGGTPEQQKCLVGEISPGILGLQWGQIAWFSQKLTREPSAMTPGDLNDLRRQGFDDKAIITIAASVSFECFLCDVAASLGVRLEDQSFASNAVAAFED